MKSNVKNADKVENEVMKLMNMEINMVNMEKEDVRCPGTRGIPQIYSINFFV